MGARGVNSRHAFANLVLVVALLCCSGAVAESRTGCGTPQIDALGNGGDVPLDLLGLRIEYAYVTETDARQGRRLLDSSQYNVASELVISTEGNVFNLQNKEAGEDSGEVIPLNGYVDLLGNQRNADPLTADLITSLDYYVGATQFDNGTLTVLVEQAGLARERSTTCVHIARELSIRLSQDLSRCQLIAVNFWISIFDNDTKVRGEMTRSLGCTVSRP